MTVELRIIPDDDETTVDAPHPGAGAGRPGYLRLAPASRDAVDFSESSRIPRWLAAMSGADAALIALALFLAIWTWALASAVLGGPGPNGAGFGVDFSHTFSAALALREGKNPYDYHALSHVQRALLLPLHLPVQHLSSVVLVGSSPFFLWLLEPMTFLPFRTAALGWIFGTYLLSGLGFLAVLRYFGWTHRLVPLVCFLVAPQVVLSAYYGNTVNLVFFGFACSLPLLRRHPLLAGMCLSVAVLKLPQAAPLVALIVLFQAPHKRRVLLGLLGFYAARNVITGVLLGSWSLAAYWRGLMSFSHSIGAQPNLVGLSGVYVGVTSPHVRFALEGTSVVIAGALTLWWAWRTRGRSDRDMLDSAWLWCVWMLATPYAHFDDEILLIIPLIAVLGRNGAQVRERVALSALYLGVGSLFLFSASVHHVQLLWLPLVGLTLCFVRARPRSLLGPVRDRARQRRVLARPSEAW